MKHSQLQDAGRKAHREIDQQLPAPDEKRTLQKLLQDQKLEIIAEGNTDFDQDGNWRFRIDSAGHLVLQKRVSGSWVNRDTWT